MEDVTHYLYKITNQVNGKLYVGVTKDPRGRQNSHFSKGERLVNKACRKYGKENLTFEIICIGTKDYIYDLEVKAIQLYNSDASTGHGYNICSGGTHGDSGNTGREYLSRIDDTPYYVSGFWFPNRRTALKSLSWGNGMFNSRHKAGVLGDTRVFKKRNGPQEFVYVSGFWFPSKKVARNSLDITLGVYEKRRSSGSLGDTTQPKRKTNSTALAVPNYFKGFWFPNLYIPSDLFGIRPESIRQRILRGYFEEKGTISDKKFVRKYLINDVPFKTLEDASEFFNIPPTTIKNRISKGVHSYGYIYEIQER